MTFLRPLTTAFGFLTRLPIRSQAVEGIDLARSLPWFPLVGAALGLALTGGERLLRGHLSAGVIAVLLVALLAILSGGLHLDGLADVFDALGGARGDRARMLAIMKDSRIGAHGAVALFLVLAAKLLAISEVVARGEAWPLFAFPVFARWAVTPLVVFFPYARAEGLGKPFNGYGRPIHVAWAAGITVALLAWSGSRLILPAAAALAVTLAVGVWLDRRIGGLTGDVYGAAIELSEVTFLIAAAVIP
jgi:adenosylcobinamide-GDP ribazoletransferase